MGLDPVTLAIGGLSAAASFSQAQSANRRAGQAAEAEKATEDVAARQRREITARNLQELEGSLRATAAGRGVAGSASVEALSLSQFESALLEESNIELNRFFAAGAADARAAAQYQNPLLAGISGFSTGISIGSGISGLLSGGGPETITNPGRSISGVGPSPNFLGAPNTTPPPIF